MPSSANAIFTVTGGLGNQLFMVAAADAFSQATGRPYKLDFSEVDADIASHGNSLREFLPEGIRVSRQMPSVVLRKLWQLGRSSALKISPSRLKYSLNDENVGYDENLFAIPDHVKFVRGYFQSHLYFSQGGGLVDSIFERMQSKSDWGREISKRYIDSETVGFHVRRGDYLSHSESLGLLDYEIITQTLGILNSGRRVAIFCEEAEFARALSRRIPGDVEVVMKPKDVADFEELVAMANCPFLVTSNSSFSFWAGRLGSPKQVHYPSPWFRNVADPLQLTPADWLPYKATWKQAGKG